MPVGPMAAEVEAPTVRPLPPPPTPPPPTAVLGDEPPPAYEEPTPVPTVRSSPTGSLVDPAVFAVLERYTQASRGVAATGVGRMFSTRPGARAVAPAQAATLEQLQAAGATIALVSQIADVTAKIAAIDAADAGATTSQQEVAGNRARADVWAKSGVPVDMRPARSGVLGAELAMNRKALQEARVQAHAAAQAKAGRDVVTKGRAARAGESSTLKPIEGPSLVTKLRSGAEKLGAGPVIDVASATTSATYAGWERWSSASDALVNQLGMASSTLGGALSFMSAVLELKAAARHGAAAARLKEIERESGDGDGDGARSLAILGSSEIAVFKESIAAGQSGAAMLSTIGGLLFATPAGPILKIVGAAASAAITVADASKDSYQAGKVVEKELESTYHGDAESSAEYVLRYGAEHRAQLLLRRARGGDAAALEALAVYGISADDLDKRTDPELRAIIVRQQGAATENIGTRASSVASSLSFTLTSPDERAAMAVRTAHAKQLMGYGRYAWEGVTVDVRRVRAKAFLRTGNQVDNERKAQLEILRVRIERGAFRHRPRDLERLQELLLPLSHFRQLKARERRRLAAFRRFGGSAGVKHPGDSVPTT